MPIEVFFILFVLGFLSSYFTNLKYLKKLRNGEENFKRIQIILTSIIFGGPVLLLFYMFDDYRLEDKMHKRGFLITGIIMTILQVILIYLLFHFQVIKLL